MEKNKQQLEAELAFLVEEKSALVLENKEFADRYHRNIREIYKAWIEQLVQAFAIGYFGSYPTFVSCKDSDWSAIVGMISLYLFGEVSLFSLLRKKTRKNLVKDHFEIPLLQMPVSTTMHLEEALGCRNAKREEEYREMKSSINQEIHDINLALWQLEGKKPNSSDYPSPYQKRR